MLLILLIPVKSFPMADSLLKAGVGAGIFVAITILAVIAYLLSKTVERKEKKIIKKTRYIAAGLSLLSVSLYSFIFFKNTSSFSIPALFHHQDNHQTSCNGR